MRDTVTIRLTLFVMASEPNYPWWEVSWLAYTLQVPYNKMANVLRELDREGRVALTVTPAVDRTGRAQLYYRLTDSGREYARRAVAWAGALPMPAADL